MIKKLEVRDKATIIDYVSAYGSQTFHFKKMLDEFCSRDVVYGFFQGDVLEGLMWFTHTNALVIHSHSLEMFKKLEVLKLIKAYKPKFIKGDERSVAGVYKIIYRTLRTEASTPVMLMRFVQEPLNDHLKAASKPINDSAQIKSALQNDLQFLLSANTYFGRKNAPVRELEKMMLEEYENKTRYFYTEGRKFVAQGLIEESGSDFAVLGGIFVAPAYRGKGYGKSMSLQLTNSILDQEKVPYLFVKKDNGIAHKLYEAIGYKDEAAYTILEVNF